MECNKLCNFNCGLLGIILGIIAGVAVGIIFSLGLIPIPLNLIRIALILSAIGLGIYLMTVLSAHVNEDSVGIRKCICGSGKYLIFGSIGTLLAGTIVSIIGITTVTIINSIFVGLTAFFFIVLLVAIVCLYTCLTKKLCDYCR